MAKVSGVDDGVENICRVLGMWQVAEFVNDQDLGGDERFRFGLELSGLGGGGEIVDEMGRRDEAGVGTVLDGGNSDGERYFDPRSPP